MPESALPTDLVAALRAIPEQQPMLICADFDGTLAPIVTRPQDAAPLPGAVELLQRLAGCERTSVAVVSGRSLADLRTLSGLDSPVTLVGSHGAEFIDGFISELTAEQTRLFAELDTALSSLVSSAPGAELERKPISIAVHVRQASRADADRVLTAVREGPGRWPGVHATAGKEVLELAVQQIDKGTAIERLRVNDELVVFVGDDVTDERGFAALRDDDIGVKVGAVATAAGYRVDGPESVLALLSLLSALR